MKGHKNKKGGELNQIKTDYQYHHRDSHSSHHAGPCVPDWDGRDGNSEYGQLVLRSGKYIQYISDLPRPRPTRCYRHVDIHAVI